MARLPKTPKWLEAARTRNAPVTGKPDWLSRALSRAGIFPLKQAEEAIAAGRVKVDKRLAKQPFMPVTAASEVTVDGKPVDLVPATKVLMFHKPAGIIVAGRDLEKIGTVFEYLFSRLPPELEGFGWHAVGRLDRDTTGLLLFTNDERFVAHATMPETHLPKRYLSKVSGTVTAEKLERLRAGVELEDGKTRPCGARQLEDGRVELVLTEGRHHQVKRMLGHVGLPVLALHRDKVGELLLDVPEGGFRLLTTAEVEAGFGFTR